MDLSNEQKVAIIAGLLPTLILLGGISDRLRRKKIILASLLLATLATFLIVPYPNIYTLFAGLPVILIGFLAENLGTVNTLFGFGAILTISNILLVNTTIKFR